MGWRTQDGQTPSRGGGPRNRKAPTAGAGDVVGPSSATDKAIARFDLATGKLLKNSSVTIDDSGNIATSGTVDGRDVSVDGTKLDGIESLADVTDSINVAAAGAIMQTTADAKGDILVALANDVFDNLAVGSNGQILVADSSAGSGVKWSASPITRQREFSYVNPAASADYLMGGIPVGATVTECYAIVNGGTSVVFSIVMRARSAPFSAGTNIVSSQTATTTGATKTVASSTLTADNILRLTTGTVTGSVTELLVTLKYTVDA
jgi:hypothetical protein